MLGTKSLCKLTGCIYRMLNWKLFVFIQFVSIYNEIAFINSADLNSFGETASAQRFTSQTYLRSMNVWVCLCLGCAYDHVWYVIICIRAVIAASLHYLKQICSAHAAHSHTRTHKHINSLIGDLFLIWSLCVPFIFYSFAIHNNIGWQLPNNSGRARSYSV